MWSQYRDRGLGALGMGGYFQFSVRWKFLMDTALQIWDGSPLKGRSSLSLEVCKQRPGELDQCLQISLTTRFPGPHPRPTESESPVEGLGLCIYGHL